MTARCFLDTNIFLYAGSRDLADAAKSEIARRLIGTEDFGISAQVLQEFVVNATGKSRMGYSVEEIEATLDALMRYPVWPVSGDLVRHAFVLKHRFRISYWDAAIIAAAQALGCEVLYSEDLNNGQDYDGVRVINPFVGIIPSGS